MQKTGFNTDVGARFALLAEDAFFSFLNKYRPTSLCAGLFLIHSIANPTIHCVDEKTALLEILKLEFFKCRHIHNDNKLSFF